VRKERDTSFKKASGKTRRIRRGEKKRTIESEQTLQSQMTTIDVGGRGGIEEGKQEGGDVRAEKVEVTVWGCESEKRKEQSPRKSGRWDCHRGHLKLNQTNQFPSKSKGVNGGNMCAGPGSRSRRERNQKTRYGTFGLGGKVSLKPYQRGKGKFRE